MAPSRTSRKVERSTPPRPANHWILYRSEKIHQITWAEKHTPDGRPKPQAEISKIIAAYWRKEPLHVQHEYERRAQDAKREHALKYPGYQFRPQKKEEKERQKLEKKAKSTKEREEAKKARERLTAMPPYGHHPPPLQFVGMGPGMEIMQIPMHIGMQVPPSLRVCTVPLLPNYDPQLYGEGGPTPPMSYAPSLEASPILPSRQPHRNAEASSSRVGLDAFRPYYGPVSQPTTDLDPAQQALLDSVSQRLTISNTENSPSTSSSYDPPSSSSSHSTLHVASPELSHIPAASTSAIPIMAPQPSNYQPFAFDDNRTPPASSARLPGSNAEADTNAASSSNPDAATSTSTQGTVTPTEYLNVNDAAGPSSVEALGHGILNEEYMNMDEPNFALGNLLVDHAADPVSFQDTPYQPTQGEYASDPQNPLMGPNIDFTDSEEYIDLCFPEEWSDLNGLVDNSSLGSKNSAFNLDSLTSFNGYTWDASGMPVLGGSGSGETSTDMSNGSSTGLSPDTSLSDALLNFDWAAFDTLANSNNANVDTNGAQNSGTHSGTDAAMGVWNGGVLHDTVGLLVDGPDDSGNSKDSNEASGASHWSDPNESFGSGSADASHSMPATIPTATNQDLSTQMNPQLSQPQPHYPLQLPLGYAYQNPFLPQHQAQAHIQSDPHSQHPHSSTPNSMSHARVASANTHGDLNASLQTPELVDYSSPATSSNLSSVAQTPSPMMLGSSNFMYGYATSSSSLSSTSSTTSQSSSANSTTASSYIPPPGAAQASMRRAGGTWNRTRMMGELSGALGEPIEEQDESMGTDGRPQW